MLSMLMTSLGLLLAHTDDRQDPAADSGDPQEREGEGETCSGGRHFLCTPGFLLEDGRLEEHPPPILMVFFRLFRLYLFNLFPYSDVEGASQG